MVTIPNRIKIEIYVLCGKYQAVSKYQRTGYYDTEIEAMNKHKEMMKAYRQALSHSN